MNTRGNKASRYISLAMLIFLILMSLACGEAAPTSEPKVSTATPESQGSMEQATDTPVPAEQATDTPIPTEQATDTPEPTMEPQPLYLGDVVEQYGYLLSAIAVEDPTTPGMFYESKPGKKLVAVEVILGNVSGEALSVNPLNATLIDDQGFTYQPELAGRDDQIITVDLSPGEKARGWIAFEVPEGATPARIEYAVDPFGTRTLEAGLALPPDGYVPDTQALAVTSPLPEAGLGDLLEQYGYSLSATAVEDPTTPGLFYEAKEGRKLVAVEIIVGNVSGATLSVNPLNAVLVDSEGFVYMPELGGRDDQLATVDLGPGEKVRGWVAFEIPEGATPASIKYLVEMFSNKYLQVRLTD